MPHVVVDGGQLDRVRRLAEVVAALDVRDGLDEEEVDEGLLRDQLLVEAREEVPTGRGEILSKGA